MKKYLYGCLLSSLFFIGGTTSALATEDTQTTGISVNFFRLPNANNLPGQNGEITKGEVSIPSSELGKKFPTTNEQINNLYVYLGVVLIGSTFMVVKQKNKRKEVDN